MDNTESISLINHKYTGSLYQGSNSVFKGSNLKYVNEIRLSASNTWCMFQDSNIVEVGDVYIGDEHTTDVYFAGWNKMFQNCKSLIKVGNITLNKNNLSNNSMATANLFYGATNLETVGKIEIINDPDSYELDLTNTFRECKQLTGDIDLRNIGTHYANIAYICNNSPKITSVKLPPIKPKSSLDGICNGCKEMVTVDFTLSEGIEVTSLNNSFEGCLSLVEVKGFEGLVLNGSANNIFKNCTSLEYYYDLTHATGVFNGAYQNCTSLKYNIDLDDFIITLGGEQAIHTSNSRYVAADYMFSGTNIRKATVILNNIKTGNSDMSYMFHNSKIKNLKFIIADSHVSKGTINISRIVENTPLEIFEFDRGVYDKIIALGVTLNGGHGLNGTGNTIRQILNYPLTTKASLSMFYNNNLPKFESITWSGMLSESWKLWDSIIVSGFSACPVESLRDLINNHLATVTSATLTVGNTNLQKLTDEDKATAVNKGWTLA